MSKPLLSSASNDPISGAPSFSIGNRCFRLIWIICWKLLAAWTPPPLHKWRILVLKLFGADVDISARVYGSAHIWYPPNLRMEKNSVMGPGVQCYCMSKITIKARAIVSQRAFLCCGSHKVSDPFFQLISKPITISEDAWICAEAFVGPGVNVGVGTVLAARAVAFTDLSPWQIYRGNPAVFIKERPFFSRGG